MRSLEDQARGARGVPEAGGVTTVDFVDRVNVAWRGVDASFQTLTAALREACSVMSVYRAAVRRWRVDTAALYRRETGRRAPGSERTRRLRKKRERALEGWEAAA